MYIVAFIKWNMNTQVSWENFQSSFLFNSHQEFINVRALRNKLKEKTTKQQLDQSPNHSPKSKASNIRYENKKLWQHQIQLLCNMA